MLNHHNNGPLGPRPSHDSFAQIAALYGLYPLTAGGVVLADQMLGGMEVATFGVFAVVSVLVGVLLIPPCALIQRYAYGDAWPLAIGKALLVGLLTAIPSPLPSVLTAGLGIAGAIGLKHRAARRETIETDGEEK